MSKETILEEFDKKYLCIGGCITSQSDFDRHFIPAHRLPFLYSVDARECVLAKDDNDRERITPNRHLIVLRPDESGMYITPTK